MSTEQNTNDSTENTVAKAATKGKPANPKKEAQTGFQRNFGNNVQLHTDLYKLGLAKFLRDMSWNDVPEIDHVEHVHHFHTYDSDGKVMTHSNNVGNHCHAMTVIPGAPGEAPRVLCGPPVRLVRKKHHGRFIKVYEPVVVAGEPDTHTHEVFYRKSNTIAKREVNIEANAVVTSEAQLTSPPSGVQA